jgi:hypothetical protein
LRLELKGRLLAHCPHEAVKACSGSSNAVIASARSNNAGSDEIAQQRGLAGARRPIDRDQLLASGEFGPREIDGGQRASGHCCWRDGLLKHAAIGE